MDLGVPKCAITCCPNKSNAKPYAFKAKIQAPNIKYNNQPLHVRHHNEPYIYLGIQLVPSLKRQLQTHITATKVVNQCKRLINCPATIKHEIKMVDTIIIACITYRCSMKRHFIHSGLLRKPEFLFIYLFFLFNYL